MFGPTDAAFAALPKALVDKLMKDKDLLKSVLLFHVLGGKVFSSQLMNDQTAPTLDNNIKLRINIYGQVSYSSLVKRIPFFFFIFKRLFLTFL